MKIIEIKQLQECIELYGIYKRKATGAISFLTLKRGYLRSFFRFLEQKITLIMYTVFASKWLNQVTIYYLFLTTHFPNFT